MESEDLENERKRQKIKNPGTMQNISYKCTEIFPRVFDGFRVIVHRSLSQHFKVTHSIFLSSITPGNYRFGATYVGSKEIRPRENVPVLLGDIDSRGKLNVIMYHVFGSRFKVQYDAQVSNRSFVSSQLTTDYFGDTWTASAILSNADFLNNSGSIVLQYLQGVTPRLDLGVEFCLLHNMADLKHPQLNHKESQVAMVGRYTTPYTTWVANASLYNVLLSCYKRASEQLEFGIELNTNFRSKESVGAVAYRISLHDHGIIFKGCVDTNTNISSVYEKRICGSSFSYAVSLNLNHRTSNFRMGLGFIVD